MTQNFTCCWSGKKLKGEKEREIGMEEERTEDTDGDREETGRQREGMMAASGREKEGMKGNRRKRDR